MEILLDDDPGDVAYYSPWREDPRPLRGILHAAYVEIPVIRFWMDVSTGSAELDASTQALARNRAARGRGRLAIGLHQLRRHAKWTDAGLRFVGALEREHDVLADRFGPSALPENPPAAECGQDGRVDVGATRSVRDALRSHVSRFAPGDQAEELLRHAF
jgi:hypothetical protein